MASLADNARFAGLSGRGAVTIDALFRRAWRLWRERGVLSTPTPELAPLNNTVIMALARDAELVKEKKADSTGRPGATPRELFVLRVPQGRLNDRALVEEVAFLAGVFERSSFRLGIRKSQKRAHYVKQSAVERFNIQPGRLEIGGVDFAGAPAAVAVLAAD